MPKEKSAGAVIFKKEGGKIYYLLLHYKKGHWDFPKGHIEKGEKEKEAALREIREETGIQDINFIKGFKEKINYFFIEKKDRNSYVSFPKNLLKKGRRDEDYLHAIFKEVVFYLAKTNTKKIKISSEHLGFKWLSYKEAIKRLTFNNAKGILKKANDYLKLKMTISRDKQNEKF